MQVRRVWYGLIVIFLVIAAVGWYFGGELAENDEKSEENFYYPGIPAGAYNYNGALSLLADIETPEEIPELKIEPLYNFTYEEVKRIAEDFGIHAPGHLGVNEHYYVFTNNSKGIEIEDNGFIRYEKYDKPLCPITIDDREAKNIADRYLEKHTKYLPKNVDIRFSHVSVGLIYGTGNEEVHIEMNCTKVVHYDCYAYGYPLSIGIFVEIDCKGDVVCFETFWSKVWDTGNHIKVYSFQEVYSWIKDNLPIPQDPEKVERVEITDVELTYGLYSPHTLEPTLKPQYYIHFSVVLKNGENKDYYLTVAGVEKS